MAQTNVYFEGWWTCGRVWIGPDRFGLVLMGPDVLRRVVLMGLDWSLVWSGFWKLLSTAATTKSVKHPAIVASCQLSPPQKKRSGVHRRSSRLSSNDVEVISFS